MQTTCHVTNKKSFRDERGRLNKVLEEWVTLWSRVGMGRGKIDDIVHQDIRWDKGQYTVAEEVAKEFEILLGAPSNLSYLFLSYLSDCQMSTMCQGHYDLNASHDEVTYCCAALGQTNWSRQRIMPVYKLILGIWMRRAFIPGHSQPLLWLEMYESW